MKVDIRDRTILEGLRPLDVASYLRSRGWEASESGPRASVWRLAGDQPAEILLPADRELADFAPRMADALAAIAIVEDRSELELFTDLTLSAHDVVRLRASIEDDGDGTIPVDAGAELIKNAREMMLAAASATVERRSFFPTRKPALATDYMSRVRLGQTELGSYIVTLLSPVSPTLHVAKQQDLGLADPFERQVTLTLARSLAALRQAASDAAATGNFESFEAAVNRGVTANLCTAVVGMTEGLGRSADLDIGISWSPARPLQEEEPSRVRFGADTAPTIREAARIIRETAPLDDYEVIGLVVHLDRRPDEKLGRIRVLSVTDGDARTISMTLAPTDYTVAIRAHKNRLPVSATGRLTKAGPMWVLDGARDFAPLQSN
jgi:hypothetical protein